jgi:chorismate mutase
MGIEEIIYLRQEIDRIDDRILILLKSRIKIAQEIGIIKKNYTIPILNRKREKEIVEKLKAKARKLKLNEKYVTILFKKIIKQSRKEQKNLK